MTTRVIRAIKILRQADNREGLIDAPDDVFEEHVGSLELKKTMQEYRDLLLNYINYDDLSKGPARIYRKHSCLSLYQLNVNPRWDVFGWFQSPLVKQYFLLDDACDEIVLKADQCTALKYVRHSSGWYRPKQRGTFKFVYMDWHLKTYQAWLAEPFELLVFRSIANGVAEIRESDFVFAGERPKSSIMRGLLRAVSAHINLHYVNGKKNPEDNLGLTYNPDVVNMSWLVSKGYASYMNRMDELNKRFSKMEMV